MREINKYYKKLEIGTHRVSDNLEKVMDKIESWSEEERLAVEVSLKEDINSSNNYSDLIPLMALIANAFTTASLALELPAFDNYTIELIAFIVVLVIILLTVGIWIYAKKETHLYVGLLCLLEEMERYHKSNGDLQKQPTACVNSETKYRKRNLCCPHCGSPISIIVVRRHRLQEKRRKHCLNDN